MSNIIRVGVIGLGSRSVLAREWQSSALGSRVVAGADLNPDALREFRTWADKSALVTDDYRELIRRDDVDAVAVLSPDHLHEEHALAVLAAGKHLFLEKPLATTTEGCDRVLTAWRASGLRMMVGFNMRHMPVCIKARESLRSGLIGDLKAIWIRHFVGSGGDFYFHDWHAQRSSSNGLLLQKGSHDIDMIHWFAGADSRRVVAFGGLDYFGGDRPNSLTCDKCSELATCPEAQPPDHPRRQCAFRSEVDVEDNNVVLMELSNGVKAAYLQCHFTPDYLRNYTFIGTKGRIEMNVERNEIFLLPRVSGRVPVGGPPRVEIPVDQAEGTHGGADPRIAQDFIEMVRDGKEPESPPIAGRMSVAAACAATASLREGGVREVSVPAGLV